MGTDKSLLQPKPSQRHGSVCLQKIPKSREQTKRIGFAYHNLLSMREIVQMFLLILRPKWFKGVKLLIHGLRHFAQEPGMGLKTFAIPRPRELPRVGNCSPPRRDR